MATVTVMYSSLCQDINPSTSLWSDEECRKCLIRNQGAVSLCFLGLQCNLFRHQPHCFCWKRIKPLDFRKVYLIIRNHARWPQVAELIWSLLFFRAYLDHYRIALASRTSSRRQQAVPRTIQVAVATCSSELHYSEIWSLHMLCARAHAKQAQNAFPALI